MGLLADRKCQCSPRLAGILLLCWVSARAIPLNAQVIPTSDIERAELLSWMDAPAALHLLDKWQVSALSAEELVHWLMVRGLAHADDNREQAEAIVRRLQGLGSTQPAAEVASHIVQASIYSRRDLFDEAEAELQKIGAGSVLPPFERFRIQAMRGVIQMSRGRNEAAVASFERLRDLANSMHSLPRIFEALTELSVEYAATGNLERAATLVTQMRTVAEQTGDELQWTEVLSLQSNIADSRGDFAARRRALLEALTHARRTNSDRSTAMVLINLSDSYLESNDYTAALEYSTEALAAARRTGRSSTEQTASFCMALAQVGLGHLAQGKRLAEGILQQLTASNSLFIADTMMQQYIKVLEAAGDLRGALDVTHRDDAVREQLVAKSRQKVILELSAKFDDERRARRIELLERDSTIKDRDLQTQRLRQQMLVTGAALVVLACGALAWGITRIRKINARWVQNSRCDPLTGLLTRRYFNEHILARYGDRPYVGCLLLIDLDHFQHINDSLGHAGGDAVLAAISRRLSEVLHNDETLVRWAGEEFLAVLDPMSELQLNVLVRLLLTMMRDEPVTWSGHSQRCTISIGYASFPLERATVDMSLDRAITLVAKALRRAKQQGRDRACLIKLMNASSEQELSTINAQFEAAVADRRVLLDEIGGAA